MASTAPETRNPWIDGLLGGLIGALVTFLAAYVAVIQLSSLSETTSADFILRLKQDFFKEETRNLIHLIEMGWLRYIPRGRKSFFEVDESAINEAALSEDIENRLLKKKAYSAYEVDDILLGHLEDLGMLLINGVLDFGMIYDVFSWYVEKTWESTEITKYIYNERAQAEDDGIYGSFEELYKKCHARSLSV